MDKSLAKLGGVCSVFVGIGYIVIAIMYLLDPVQKTQNETVYFSLVATSIPHIVIHTTAALTAFFALGAIPAISQLIRSQNEGWARWATNLIYLATAIFAIQNGQAVATESALARAFATGDPMAQAAVRVVEPFQTLAQPWFLYSLNSLWLFTINLIAIRRGVWSRYLAFVGLALAIVSGLAPIGELLGVGLLNSVLVMLGFAILQPVWNIWMGLVLWRKQSA